jgi:ELWxxDGT repeat protein
MDRARRIAAVTCLSLALALLPTFGHTATAPSLVRDITPTPVGSSPGSFTRLGEDLLFFAENRRLGTGLWKRTPEGTTEFVKRIESSCSGLQMSNGVLFFCADDGEHGRELWRSDGTLEGTFMVKDIAVGPGFSEPRDLTRQETQFSFRRPLPTQGSGSCGRPMAQPTGLCS